MFPQLRERIGSALDLVVEFSTLGEYRLGADGALCHASALGPAVGKHPARPGATPPAPEREPQLGGAGDSVAAHAAVRRIVAGGATGLAPVATPAARRASESTPSPPGEREAEAAEGAASALRRARRAETAEAPACRGERRRPGTDPAPLGPNPRPHAAAAPEQLCLAV